MRIQCIKAPNVHTHATFLLRNALHSFRTAVKHHPLYKHNSPLIYRNFIQRLDRQHGNSLLIMSHNCDSTPHWTSHYLPSWMRELSQTLFNLLTHMEAYVVDPSLLTPRTTRALQQFNQDLKLNLACLRARTYHNRPASADQILTDLGFSRTNHPAIYLHNLSLPTRNKLQAHLSSQRSFACVIKNHTPNCWASLGSIIPRKQIALWWHPGISALGRVSSACEEGDHVVHAASSKVVVRPSTLGPIAKDGLFTLRDITTEVPWKDGVRIRSGHKGPICEYQGATDSFTQESDYILHVDGLTIDARHSRCHARFANDCLEASRDNCTFKEVGNKIYLFPIPDVIIAKGDELFVAYGADYWFGKWKQWDSALRTQIIVRYGHPKPKLRHKINDPYPTTDRQLDTPTKHKTHKPIFTQTSLHVHMRTLPQACAIDPSIAEPSSLTRPPFNNTVFTDSRNKPGTPHPYPEHLGTHLITPQRINQRIDLSAPTETEQLHTKWYGSSVDKPLFSTFAIHAN